MGYLFLFILTGVVVIVGMIIWPRVVWLVGIISGRSGRPLQENVKRSPHARRLRAFWIVYIFLLVLVIAYGLSQALTEEHIGFGQQDLNCCVGVMSAIAEN